jgi:acyl-homoserine lactone synthase
MFCIHDDSSAASDAVMRAMFEARKRVFIDLLGWDLPVLAERYEIDQFDDPNARYLVLADTNNRHLASARLLPTVRPHILDTLFRDLCEDAPPSGPDTYEITRLCLDRSLRAAERRHWRDALVTGLVAYALEHEIRTYTGVAEIHWLKQILAFGWRAEPLGPPRTVGGMPLGALRISVDTNTLPLLAANGILPPAAHARAEAA